jgi:hypothetical protein
MTASCERLKTLFTDTPEALTKIKQRATEAQSLAERYEFKLGQHGELLDPYGGGVPPGMNADDAQRRREMGTQIQEQIKQALQDATDLNDKVAAPLGKEREAMDDVFGNGSGSFEQAPAHDTNNERIRTKSPRTRRYTDTRQSPRPTGRWRRRSTRTATTRRTKECPRRSSRADSHRNPAKAWCAPTSSSPLPTS